jgi:hypothetical protein
VSDGSGIVGASGSSRPSTGPAPLDEPRTLRITTMLLHRPKSSVWIAGIFLVSLLTVPGSAPADDYYETVYLPTSSVVTYPTTSSVMATSYVVPTSYTSSYFPTTYIPTTYTSSIIPTTYIPTSTVLATDSVLIPTTSIYYRPSLFRSRRYVERTSYTYAPTSYLMPTSYLLPTTYVSSSILSPTSYLIDSGVVTTSMASSACDSTPSVAPTKATNKPQATNRNTSNGPGIVSEPTNATAPNDRKPSATYNSLPSEEMIKNSDVPPPVPSTAPAPTQTPPNPATAPSTAEKAPLPQPGPLTGSEVANPPAQNNPAPPTDGGVAMPPPGKIGNTAPNEMMYRQSRRPSFDSRNILRGRILSAETNQPVEGVTVIISNQTRNFSDRQAMTNVDGEFKVSLPDGDWTVKVKMDSGNVYTVGQDFLTASNGKITNPSGRNVGEMVIHR